VILLIVYEPEVAFLPDHPSEAVQVVAFVDTQESVAEDPATTSTVPEELLAFNVIDTAPPPEEDEELDEEELDDELVQF